MAGEDGVDGGKAGRRRCSAGASGFVIALALLCLGPAASLALATESGGQEPDPLIVSSIDETPVLTAALPPARSMVLESQRQETASELAAIADRIRLSRDTVAALDREIEALKSDHEAIRAAMVDAAEKQKTASQSLSAIETRIGVLSQEEGLLKASLQDRKALFAQVLAALQRMGRKPPPALLVKPEDALGSVRSAILLGSVVPGLRQETESLVADLNRLSAVHASLDNEKRQFAGSLEAHRREATRLDRLAASKKALEETNRQKRLTAATRAETLAAEAADLRGLIASLERDVRAAEQTEAAEREAQERARQEAARRVAEEQAREREAQAAEAERVLEAARELAAREVAEAAAAEAERRQVAAQAQAADQSAAVDKAVTALADAVAGTETTENAQEAARGSRLTASIETEDLSAQTGEMTVAALDPADAPVAGEPAEPTYDIDAIRRAIKPLEPSAAFSTMRGRLSRPVVGRQLIGYGEADDIGKIVTGVSYAARDGDTVTSPFDAKVLYAGAFRSYGQVLILDVGDGYHVVLAGMDRIDVENGQFVSAGEPVAAMGARRVASVSMADFGATGPSLYVEFRKAGKPIDPTPWWVDDTSGRTRNDS